MPLDIYDHFDFDKDGEKPFDFLWNNNENIRTESGNVEIGWWNSGYIESKAGNVEIHGYNSGGVELVEGNITIHGDSSGSISSKKWEIRVWGVNLNVIETGSWNVSVRDNGWTIITESGTIWIWNIDIRIVKKTHSETLILNSKRKLKDILINKNKTISLSEKKEYRIIVGGSEIDYYSKQITTDGIECQSDKNFVEDTIRFNYIGQTIIVTENRVLISPETEEEWEESIKENNKKKWVLDDDLRKYIK